jgi:hypothetical protein
MASDLRGAAYIDSESGLSDRTPENLRYKSALIPHYLGPLSRPDDCSTYKDS